MEERIKKTRSTESPSALGEEEGGNLYCVSQALGRSPLGPHGPATLEAGGEANLLINDVPLPFLTWGMLIGGGQVWRSDGAGSGHPPSTTLHPLRHLSIFFVKRPISRLILTAYVHARATAGIIVQKGKQKRESERES